VARGSRRARRIAAAATALALAGGLGAGSVALAERGPTRPPEPAAARARTTTVVRTDLSDGQTLPGTLGFGPRTTVKGSGTGTVTGLPAAGATVTRGQALYRVDDQPVVLFYGTVPLFRTVAKPGLRGHDVTVIAENLRAPGYDIGPWPAPGARDGRGDVLTPALAAAVKRWQLRAGMKPTGALGPGQVAVLPGPVRVGGVEAQLGDTAGEPLLAVTSTRKTVTVPVDPTGLAGSPPSAAPSRAKATGARATGARTRTGRTAPPPSTSPSHLCTPPTCGSSLPRRSRCGSPPPPGAACWRCRSGRCWRSARAAMRSSGRTGGSSRCGRGSSPTAWWR
jgi:Putative peptidoglycan binding domain